MNLVLLIKKSLAINRIHYKCEAKQGISGLAGVLQSYAVMLFLLIIYCLI